MLDVSIGDALIKDIVFLILSVVIGAPLPDGVRRVADDDANIGFILFVNGKGILHHKAEKILDGGIGVEGKSIGQTNAVEGEIILIARAGVEGVFDVDGGDVISQQDNLIGVQFVLILATEILIVNQFELNQSGDESAGAGERIENVNAPVGKICIKLRAEDGINGFKNEVDDLNGGVDDAEFFNGLVESDLEKFIVELDDDLLAVLGIGNVFATILHRLINFLELLIFLVGAAIVEQL